MERVMVASASGIRAGAAYVEISADDTPMQRRLAESANRLRRWAAESSGAVSLTRGTEASALGGEGGFFRGGFRGAELMDVGLKFGTAIMGAKAAIKDVQIFSSIFRGDMEGARKAAEELPFGLGGIVKELSGPVDAAMKKFFFRLKGVKEGDYRQGDTSLAAAKREVEQYNRGATAIGAIEKALGKATMSARAWAKAEVDALNLSASQAKKLLALKLRLIDVEEGRAAAEKAVAERERGEGLIRDAMDQYARLKMSPREFVEYEVRSLGLAANQAETLLNWRLDILDVTERQAAAEKRLSFDMALARTIEGLTTRIAEARGELDALAVEEAAALKPLTDAFADGMIEFDEYLKKAGDLKNLFEELREAQEGAKLKRRGESLKESLRTPVERARDEVTEYQRLRDARAIDTETYNRAVRKALEDAAAALPDTVREAAGVRGTFSAEARGLAVSGAAERTAVATEATAKNIEIIKRELQAGGVVFT